MKTLAVLIPTRYQVIFATGWDGSFGHFDKGSMVILISFLNISGARRYLALGGFVGKEAVVILICLVEIPSLYSSLCTGIITFAVVMSQCQC